MKSSRLQSVDMLRGVASMAVAWFHLTNTYSESSPVRISGMFGWLGVEVFFVISGFVIPYAISKSATPYQITDFPRFFARRTIRLEPPYIISIVLVIALWHLSALSPAFKGSGPDYTILQIVANIFYLVPITNENWLQPVYWTLAFEIVFYITCGLFYRQISSSWFWLFFIVIIILCSASVISPFFQLFILGISAFRYHAGCEKLSRSLLVLSVTASALWFETSIFISLTGVVAALIIMAVAKKQFSMNPIVRLALILGTISYSLYLIHVPIGGRVVNLGRRFVDGPFEELMLSVVATLICLVAATVYWVLIERTALQSAKLLKRRKQISVATS